MIQRSWSVLASVLLAGSAAPATVALRDGEVRAVSLVPASEAGRAELIIQVRGAVEVSDRTLADPNRIVLDVAGATLAPEFGRAGYDGVKRAGVLNVRISQFTPQVVRVVLDMERLVPYKVERSAEAIRVSFGAEQGFLAWNGQGTARAPSPAQDAEPVEATAAPALRTPRAMLQGQVRRVTVSFDKASIEDVVATFQRVSGKSIILGKGVTGTVTAEIIDQPWPEAFYSILASQGLSVQEMPGGILRVDAPANLAEIDSLGPMETRFVRVNYARVAELANSLKGILTPKRGVATPDTASNSIIVTDTKSNIDNVVELIGQLDLRPKLVSIQAKIIFVDRTDLEQLGFKYDIGSRNQFYNKLIQRPDPLKGGAPFDPGVNVVNLGGNEVAAIGNAEAVISHPAIDLLFSTALGGFSITSFLQALEQVDLSDVQAEPTITTQDNKQATIRVGEDIPVRVIDANAPTAAGQAVRANVQFRETGIKLLVTPHVTNDGQISLDLATERSSLQTLAAADLGFIIAKQETKNQLLVADGETAVIGGLTVTTVEKSKSGIPLLSSLPLIGSLFSFSSTKENRKDLIILVTPRVLSEGVVPPGL
ncbi:MAG TPA: secretin N-terminal domain-containing protein [Gemmatimonadales bacterium]|jgi:type IV pilus assembly protein PilQ|nr:secretin N-terminal domain-containing protein [Gemmatimonadales bacterium]